MPTDCKRGYFEENCFIYFLFCLGKYSFSLEAFWIHFVFSKKINVLVIADFCFGKYIFRHFTQTQAETNIYIYSNYTGQHNFHLSR